MATQYRPPELRAALHKVSGLTKRNQRQAREVLCSQFRRAQLRDERATIKACRLKRSKLEVAGHDAEYVQGQLILSGLIPDCRIKARVKPKRKPLSAADRRQRNRRKAQRRTA